MDDLAAEIDAALASIEESGFCAAAGQPEVIAVAAPLITSDKACAVKVSVLTTDPYEQVVNGLAPKLLTLRDDIQFALERAWAWRQTLQRCVALACRRPILSFAVGLVPVSAESR